MSTVNRNSSITFHTVKGPAKKVWVKEQRTKLRKITNSIWRDNEILREFRRLNRCRKIEEIATDFREKLLAWNVNEYVQRRFRLSFDIEKDKAQTRCELADIIFYYIMKKQELSAPFRIIIRRIWDSFIGWTRPQISWNRLCSELLSDNAIFNQFYRRLDESPSKLEYFIYQYPDLVLRSDSRMMDRLVNYLPFQKLDLFLKNVCDDSGRKLLVTTKWTPPLLKLYDGLAADLCDFILDQFPILSAEEKTGPLPPNPFTSKPKIKSSVEKLTEYAKNVAHSFFYKMSRKLSEEPLELGIVRSKYSQILDLLIHTYTPTHKTNVLQLLTTLTFQLGHTRKSAWLLDQVQSNRYILHNKPAVLIIYATKNRPGAEEEAAAIYNTLRLKRCSTMRVKDETGQEIIELVKQAANEPEPTTKLPPSALIVVVLAHGTVGAFNDSTGQSVSLKSVEDAMCSDNLKDRPKILITQCCQAHLCTIKKYREERETLSAYTPSHSHFCSVMSCGSGETSQRAVLIPKLAQRIEYSRKDESFMKIVADVFKKMSGEKQTPIERDDRQTPIILSTLTGLFCPGNIMGWKFLAF